MHKISVFILGQKSLMNSLSKSYGKILLSVLFILTIGVISLMITPAFANNSQNNSQNDDEIAAAIAIGQHHSIHEPLAEPMESIHDSTASIGEILQEFGKAQSNDSQADAPKNAVRTSNAPALSHDKLILNEPVVDVAQILSTDEKRQLNEQLFSIYQKNLAQMAIVIIPTTEGVPIFDYTMRIAERWQLGDKDNDNGILILVAINDREMFIATGHGMEGILPDAVINRIIREDIRPAFGNGQYAQGLSAGIARINERLTTDPEVLAKADKLNQSKSSDITPAIVVFVFALVIGSMIVTLLGRLLGATLMAGGYMYIVLSTGAGILIALFFALLLWLILLMRTSFLPSNLPTSNRHDGFGGGGFGGGGFGGGGFGGGGFGGGGGSFGGGGAGGSW